MEGLEHFRERQLVQLDHAPHRSEPVEIRRRLPLLLHIRALLTCAPDHKEPGVRDASGLSPAPRPSTAVVASGGLAFQPEVSFRPSHPEYAAAGPGPSPQRPAGWRFRGGFVLSFPP